jgi:hypothetical protein
LNQTHKDKESENEQNFSGIWIKMNISVWDNLQNYLVPSFIHSRENPMLLANGKRVLATLFKKDQFQEGSYCNTFHRRLIHSARFTNILFFVALAAVLD